MQVEGGTSLAVIVLGGQSVRKRPFNAKNAMQNGIENVRVDRLGDMVIHAGFQATLPVTAQGIRGHRDDGHRPIRETLADFACSGKSVHDRHLDIHEDGVILGAFDEGDSLGTILRDFRHGAKGAQQAESHVPVQLIVLDDKDTAAGEEQRHGVAGAGGVFGVGLHGIMPQDPERGIEQLGRIEGLDQDLVDICLCRGIHHIVAAIGCGQDVTGFLA